MKHRILLLIVLVLLAIGLYSLMGAMGKSEPQPTPQVDSTSSLPGGAGDSGLLGGLADLFGGGNPPEGFETPEGDVGAPEAPSYESLASNLPRHVRGSVTPLVTVIEYSDLDCPYCRQIHPDLIKLVNTATDVAWEYRHFPLRGHADAPYKAGIAECVAKLSEANGEDQFWKYIDATMRSEPLLSITSSLKMDGAKLDECAKSTEIMSIVADSTKEGEAHGLTGTPYLIFMNNKTKRVEVVPGYVPLAGLKEIVADMRGE